MSEYINNATRRKEIIKSVLRELHAGKTIDEVKADFGALAREVGTGEIAAIEQELIDEGLPVEEIQNLCDVHVAVFRDGLDDQRPPESVPGHPVHTLRAENDVLLRALEEMNYTLDQAVSQKSGALLRTFIYQLDKLSEIDKHYLRKEYLLFPYLEKYGFVGPSKVMWGIHDQIRAEMKALKALAGGLDVSRLETIRADYKSVAVTMREMAYKEEKILIPTALELLREEDWGAIRAQEDEMGYFLIVPAREWRPITHDDLHVDDFAAPEPAPQAVAPAPELPAGLLPLNTGALWLDQIDLLLRNLPVDVTYVDEHDEVRYYSQTRERIFERTPAIIGRKVQNCHPPQSVHVVQRILDDFRSGKRSTADFWIHMGGRFVMIRYFALRDSGGAYRGTLEVTQDATELRALQGERRLLND